MTARLRALSDETGGFAMLALDQRESLREMFPPLPDGSLVDDDTLTSFKRTAGSILWPLATGILLDRPLAIPQARRPDFVPESCGVILAADELHSIHGVGVVSTGLDPMVDEAFIRATGAAAIKLLVIWRREHDTVTQDLVARFLDLADRSDVASFVEGIVRPPLGEDWRDLEDRHAAILEAAEDIGRDADVYKAEVPGYKVGDVSGVREASRALTLIVGHPWVVLSNGVHQPDFASAVHEATAGGASGFLAGRAIWADTVAEPDPARAISERSVARLRELSAIVKKSRIRATGAGGSA